MSDARPLIVIPQLAGSADLVRPFTHALPPALPVIVIEPPGFGRSPSPHGVPSTRALAHAAIDEWTRRNIGRAHLFGISLGGMIAQWIAIDAPESIDHLVLASTTTRGIRAVTDAGLRALALARCLVEPDEDAAVCLVDHVLSHREHVCDRDAMHAAASSHDADREAGAIRAPTLVVSGDADRIVSRATQARLAERIPGARHLRIAGAGHDITIEQPALLAREVAEFLGAAT